MPDRATFASKKVADVFVIGDSSDAGDMPKSAFSANSQAKAVSNELEAEFAGKPRYPNRYRNTCWSLLGPANSVKIGAYYEPKDGKVAVKLGFVSDATEDSRTREKSFKESSSSVRRHRRRCSTSGSTCPARRSAQHGRCGDVA